MTVAAIGQGPPGTYNIIVVDHHVPVKPVSYEVDKLVRQREGVYFTIVGDELVLWALTWLAEWTDPLWPDLEDHDTILAALMAAEQWRLAFVTAGQALPPPQDTSILVSTRDKAFHWHAARKGTTFTNLVGPTYLLPGQLLISYGGQPRTLNFPVSASRPFDAVWNEIVIVHQAHKGLPTALPYPLVGRYSGAVLEQAPSVGVQRVHPFQNLLHQIAMNIRALPRLPPSTWASFPTPKGIL